MNDIRVGLIGCGGISGAHLPQLRDAEGCKIRALCDINKDRLNAAGDKYGVPAERRFTDYRDLISHPEVDAVDICTPNYLHVPMAEAAVEAGKPFCCEKPLGVSYDETLRLKELADAKGIKSMVCFSYRFKPAVRYAKYLVDRGEIGNVISIYAQYFKSSAFMKDRPLDWRFVGHDARYGVSGDLGVHILDLASFLAGDVTAVTADLGIAVKERKRIGSDEMAPVETDDFCHFLAKFSGGASATAQYVLRQLGAREVVVISRHGEDNYENLDRHADAQIAVNTTPVGMYPNTGVSPVDLHRLPRLEAALDVVYNPARTEFLLQAEALGFRRANGLLMLAAQAKKSCEDFTGEPVDDAKIFSITKALEAQMHNVILIGMPGSGKTTIGALVAKRLGRTFVDADSALEREAGMPIPEIFRLEGEAGFRRRETAVLAELGRQSGLVLATGGGSVTREENYPLLHQNGEIFCLQRALERLPSAGRPVSQALGAQTIYAQRKPLYARFADAMIDNNGTPETAAAQILEVLGCSC